MGLLVNGKWHTDWYDTNSTNGQFVRQESQFRHQIGSERFPAESGRYHLFVSLACPWAHRTLIFRKLKNLESVIGVTVVNPKMLDKGWELDDALSTSLGYDASPVENLDTLYELYLQCQPNYSGRVTVPVLWDKLTGTIVNNESAEIIRMLNSAFNDYTLVNTDYCPGSLLKSIDKINDFVYHNINNGVYKAGFATTQEAYEKAVYSLFEALDKLDSILAHQRYLTGNTVIESDWRLFTTLIRFDTVYFGHFKTNIRQIEDYPNLSGYLRDLYQHPGIAQTVNFKQIKTHYYYSHDTINPTRIIPAGPRINYLSDHKRDRNFRKLVV